LEAAIATVGGSVSGSIGGSVGELGEFGLIKALASRMPAGPGTSVGIGDDSAVVAAPSGSVVAAVDMVIEGRHFLRSLSSGRDVGIKAAARSLADIAAMGAVPTALLAAVALPPALPAEWALDLASGLALEAERAGAGIVGGDTASADAVTVTVTALGDLGGHEPVLRSGASPGDIVAVCGPLGHSAAGYALLTGSRGPEAPRGPEALIAAHLRPAPSYAAGPEAARLGATAMIDVSDGLLADLGHVAAASGVAIDLSLASLAPSPANPLSSLTDHGFCPRPQVLDWILTGGEDHALVAAFPADATAGLPERWHVIGVVAAGTGVTVDGRPHEGAAAGWEHFR
jgi:thiamine-monophosphate kinase